MSILPHVEASPFPSSSAEKRNDKKAELEKTYWQKLNIKMKIGKLYCQN